MITDRIGLHSVLLLLLIDPRHHLERLVNFALVLPTTLVGYFVGKPKDSEDTFSFVTPIIKLNLSQQKL